MSVLPGALGAAGRGEDAAHPLVGEDKLQERLRPGRNAGLAHGFEVPPRRGVVQQAATAQGDHHRLAKR